METTSLTQESEAALDQEIRNKLSQSFSEILQEHAPKLSKADCDVFGVRYSETIYVRLDKDEDLVEAELDQLEDSLYQKLLEHYVGADACQILEAINEPLDDLSAEVEELCSNRFDELLLKDKEAIECLEEIKSLDDEEIAVVTHQAPKTLQ